MAKLEKKTCIQVLCVSYHSPLSGLIHGVAWWQLVKNQVQEHAVVQNSKLAARMLQDLTSLHADTAANPGQAKATDQVCAYLAGCSHVLK